MAKRTCVNGHVTKDDKALKCSQCGVDLPPVPKRSKLPLILGIIGALIVCGIIGTALGGGDKGTTMTSQPTAEVAQVKPTDVAAKAPAATQPPAATKAPVPTNTPAPTNTPTPTETPLPPTATPEPIILSGSGDSILDFENPFGVAIAHIKGNASSRHFAVTSYGSDGRQIDLLVNTTEPYEGIRPINFRGENRASRFEVKATGPWEIQILPLGTARSASVPGTVEGKGDDVAILGGSKPDLAKIKGNAAARHFAVTGYGQTADLLVNTTDPYEGTVILSPDTLVLEIKAEGAWSIETTGK